MKREEAISRIQRALNVPNRLQGLVLIDEESANMAIEALNREQQIIENGYTGREMRIRIGGKLFAIRELAQ